MFIEFEAIENVRDLGGLLRVDGARTKSGLLFRSGRLSEATDADLEKLRAMGICAAVDFRDADEIRKHPDREVPGMRQYAFPALPPLKDTFHLVEEKGLTARIVHDDFQRLYRVLAQSNEAQEAYAGFFRVLLESEGKPVLWHCTQGKDRTGAAALLLLTALGIDEDTILRDYLLSNDFMQSVKERFDAMEHPPLAPEISAEVLFVHAENLRLYRRCLEIEYGSVENYLELVLEIGPDEIEKLENYYLEFPEV